MTVFVGHPNNMSGRAKKYYMVADSLKEMHSFAEDLEVQKFFQKTSSLPHYIISQRKKEWAVRLGAQEASVDLMLSKAQGLRDQLLEEKVQEVWENPSCCEGCGYKYKGTTLSGGDDPSECSLLISNNGSEELKLCPEIGDY